MSNTTVLKNGTVPPCETCIKSDVCEHYAQMFKIAKAVDESVGYFGNSTVIASATLKCSSHFSKEQGELIPTLSSKNLTMEENGI